MKGNPQLRAAVRLALISSAALLAVPTAYAQDQLGDLVFVELPSPGARPEKGAPAAVVESVKAASEVYAPVSGEITEINQAIVDDPALVNRDPMGKGWFFKIKIFDLAQVDRLLDEKAYQAMIA